MKEELYYFPGGDEVFTLQLAGYSWCDGSYHICRPASECWVLEQVLQGTGRIIVDGVHYTASAGDVYLLPKGSEQEYFSDSADPWRKIFMNLCGSLPDALFSAYQLAGNVIFSGCKTEALFLSLYEFFKQPPSPEQLSACALKFHEICAALYACRHAARYEPPEAAAIKLYLDQNVHRLVKIQELAETIYRSADYTAKLFKKTYGCTPYAYLLEKKMELACLLLQNTSLPIQEISARLGYEDAHYFSGLFRQRMGVPPRVWRTKPAHF